MSRCGRINSQRDGYVLLIVVMLLFGIMALAALVIDVGLIRLTQRQMQTAADGAALEGLRFRDDLSIADPVQRDQQRRLKASNSVANTLDDDLDATNYDDGVFDSESGWLGAGPVVELSGSVGLPGLVASQELNLSDVPVYKPSTVRPNSGMEAGLGINLVNDVQGDMVAGDYSPEPPSGTPADQRHRFHSESNDYSRADFTPGSTSAFLVRMRRSGEPVQDDVSTSGPVLPYLFARGSMLNRGSLSAGVKVRTTSISDTQHVLTVGLKVSQVDMEGLANFAVQVDFWNSLPVETATAATINTEVMFYATGTEPPTTVGRRLTAGVLAPPQGQHTGYVPIFAEVFDGVATSQRVIGFGLANVVVGSSADPILITPFATRIATENAAAILAQSFDRSNLSSEQVTQIYQIVLSANRSLSRSLLAPVSVR